MWLERCLQSSKWITIQILNAEILLNVQNNLNHNIFSDIKKNTTPNVLTVHEILKSTHNTD